MIYVKALLVGALVVGWAGAQTYDVTNTDPDFPVKANQTLGVRYAGGSATAATEKKPIQTPGESWKPKDVVKAPEIYADDWKPDAPINGSALLLLMVDTDIPEKDHRGTLLHWLIPNLAWASLTSEGDTPVDGFTIPLPPLDQQPAPYKPPQPPAGDVPHAYTFVLFNQPPGFNMTPFDEAIRKRTDFDVADFVAKMNLGSVALGANYLRVENKTKAKGTSSYPPARETGSKDDPRAGKPGEDGGGDRVAGSSGAEEEAVFWPMVVGTVAFAVVMATMLL